MFQGYVGKFFHKRYPHLWDAHWPSQGVLVYLAAARGEKGCFDGGQMETWMALDFSSLIKTDFASIW